MFSSPHPAARLTPCGRFHPVVDAAACPDGQNLIFMPFPFAWIQVPVMLFASLPDSVSCRGRRRSYLCQIAINAIAVAVLNITQTAGPSKIDGIRWLLWAACLQFQRTNPVRKGAAGETGGLQVAPDLNSLAAAGCAAEPQQLKPGTLHYGDVRSVIRSRAPGFYSVSP